uniref:Uncharacterized protein n=1 Tax=Marmota marmota marmota TaxID=9994 RepID=A0A8C5ZRW3_MARMA
MFFSSCDISGYTVRSSKRRCTQSMLIQHRESYRRKDCVFPYFEDNTGIIVNNKSEMKRFATTRPVEQADSWPRIAPVARNNAWSLAH